MENKVKLVPSMKEKVEGDGAWCASFALAWREFEKVVLDGDFEYKGESELVKNLIEQCKKNIEVSEKDCYVKSGKMTVTLKKEIAKAIKKKFKTKSDVLDKFKFSKDENTTDVFVYAIIMFMLKFPEEFDIYDEELPFGEGDCEALTKAKYFGIIHSRKRKELYDQVNPLFYNSDNDFALSLDSKDGKKVVLYRTDTEENFETTYEKILEKTGQYKEKIEVRDVAIPNLKLDILNDFEIEGEFLNRKNGMPYKVSKAMQTLKFELNSKGAKVKSEAAMAVKCMAVYRPVTEIRNFYFTNTFYLYIVDNDNPIVAMRVNDIKKFK